MVLVRNSPGGVDVGTGTTFRVGGLPSLPWKAWHTHSPGSLHPAVLIWRVTPHSPDTGLSVSHGLRQPGFCPLLASRDFAVRSSRATIWLKFQLAFPLCLSVHLSFHPSDSQSFTSLTFQHCQRHVSNKDSTGGVKISSRVTERG